MTDVKFLMISAPLVHTLRLKKSDLNENETKSNHEMQS